MEACYVKLDEPAKSCFERDKHGIVCRLLKKLTILCHIGYEYSHIFCCIFIAADLQALSDYQRLKQIKAIL